MFKPINVLVRYDNEFGEQEMRYLGFLTGNDHAMYVEEYNRILFISTVPTSVQDEYLETSGFCCLGTLEDGSDPEAVIGTLAKQLHQMTAYEFMMKVVVHVREEVVFGDLIIPKLLQHDGR